MNNMEFTEEHLLDQFEQYLNEPWPKDNGDGPYRYDLWKELVYLKRRTFSE
jgi:hypothetical protein